MKTLFKISRSIITSLLILLLIGTTFIHIGFTALRMNARDIEHLIDREKLLETGLDEVPENDALRSVILNYIDDYIKYVFHKKSYPSIQTVDFKDLTEEEKLSAEKLILKVSDTLDIEYERVIQIRNFNNFISNGSIYLIINVAVFLLFVILSIISLSFKKGSMYGFLSVSIGGLISLLFLLSRNGFLNKFPDVLKNFIESALSEELISSLFKLSVIYFVVGFLIFTFILVYDKFLKKKFHK